MSDDRYPSWPELFRWLTVLKDRVETLPVISPEQILGGGALTRVNDANVTVTLGGEPETALLRPVTLTIGWTGVLKVPRGGTGLSSVATGDLLYGSASNVLSRLAATSNGFVLKLAAGLPAWTSGAALTRVDDTNVTLTLGGSPTVALLAATSLTLGWTGTLSVARGGTGLAAVATGDLLYGSAANTLSRRAIGSAGDLLTVSGGLPVWAASSGLGTGDLTRVDDTNVTLTLGGAPTDALFKDVSLTLGWTGTLAVARGGSGTGTTFTAGSVVFAGASGVYSQDNANFSWDDVNNCLGVGITPIAGNKIYSWTGNLTDTSGATYYGLRGHATSQAVAASAAVIIGIGGTANTNESGNFNHTGRVVGIETVATHANTNAGGTASDLRGASLTSFVSGAGPATLVYGFHVRYGLSSSGGIAAARGIYLNPFISGAGNITTHYGIHIDAPSLSSTGVVTTGYALVTASGAGNTGLGTLTPTAVLHLKAGTATASTAPLKFTSGTNLTTAEAGAVEFTTDDFFATITTGSARKAFVLDDGARLTSGKIPIATTNGRLVDLTASSAYTPTNVTTDRTYDANATTVDELADVIGTVIADLQAKGILG
jgi:hypothetical protein